MVKKNNISMTMEDIQTLVKKDSKSRYLLKNNKIRANQGHSIKLNITMNKFMRLILNIWNQLKKLD